MRRRPLVTDVLRCGHGHTVRQIRKITGGRTRVVTREVYRLVGEGALEEGEYRGRRWYRLRRT